MAPNREQSPPSINSMRREAQGACSTHGRSGDDVDGAPRVGVGRLLAAIKYLEVGQRGGARHSRPAPPPPTAAPGGGRSDRCGVGGCPGLSRPWASPGSCKSATDVHTSAREPTAAGRPLRHSKSRVRPLNPQEVGGGARDSLGSRTVFVEKILQSI